MENRIVTKIDEPGRVSLRMFYSLVRWAFNDHEIGPSALNNLTCHITENPSRFSVDCIDSHDRLGFVIGRVNRAASVG